MRSRIIILFALILLSFTAISQDSFANLKDSISVDYEFLHSQYLSVYAKNPAALSLWDYNSWSFIGADFVLAKGEFRNPQEYSEFSDLNIKTESVYKIEEKGWTFHGMFQYNNGTADSVHTNLSYDIPSNGSPYYLFMYKSGVWNLQKYEFDVTAVKEINKRFSLGAKLVYNGNLAFRQIDTRNDQKTLFSDIMLSGGYKVDNKNMLSVGSSYRRVKTEPSLSDKYTHPSADLTYNRYLNAGLGTYEKNINYGLKKEDQAFGILTQWIHSSCPNKYSLFYKMDLGEENYFNERKTSIHEQSVILKYRYMSYIIGASFLKEWEGRFINITANSNFIKGEGSQLLEPSDSYLANYETNLFNMDINATLYQPSSIVRRIKLITSLENESRLDKNYGYQFDYLNILTGLVAQFTIPFKKGTVSLESGGLFKKNLSSTNSPNAADDNIYTTWIANPTMSYFSSDFFKLPTQFKYGILLKNYFVEFAFNATIIKPFKINSPIGAMFTTDDNYCTFGLSTKFYF